MDTAVALVQTYLYANGYFTVTEYPILEHMSSSSPRTITDVDVLAVRFPGAGSVSIDGDTGGIAFAPDPELGTSDTSIDVIIAEVKEGAAELNHAATNPEVLRAAIGRVGRSLPEVADELVASLIETGEATHPIGVRFRLMVFASKPPNRRHVSYTWMSHGHISLWLREQLRSRWDVVKSVQSKDPALGFMLLDEKAIRGEQ
jgi:hypothetical protein